MTSRKNVKSESIKTEKVEKVEKVEDKATERNIGTSRLKVSKNMGIYLSISRIREEITRNKMNQEYVQAIQEIRDLEKDKKPLDKLSRESALLLERAEDVARKRQDKSSKRAKKPVSDKPADPSKKAPVAKSVKTEYDRAIHNIRMLQVQFGREPSKKLCALICYTIHKLVESTMNHVLEQKKRLVDVEHIFAQNIQHVDMSFMYSNLPAFVKAEQEYKARQLAQAQTEATANKDGKKKKKKSGSKKPKTKKEEHPAIVAAKKEAKKAQAKNNSDPSKKFAHYVKQICYNVINHQIDAKHTEFATIRVRKTFEEFCSELIVQMIDQLVKLMHHHINLFKNHSVTNKIVNCSIASLAMSSSALDVNTVCKHIDDKVRLFDKFIEEKKKLKAAEKAKEATASA